jgi:hypothetical protein
MVIAWRRSLKITKGMFGYSGWGPGLRPTLKLVRRRGQAAAVACTNIGDKRWASEARRRDELSANATPMWRGLSEDSASWAGAKRSANSTRPISGISSLGIKNPFKINLHIGNQPWPPDDSRPTSGAVAICGAATAVDGLAGWVAAR